MAEDRGVSLLTLERPLVDAFGDDDGLLVGSKGLPFRTVRGEAYDRLERDMQTLLSGAYALGSTEL